MANFVFNRGKYALMTALASLASGTLKCLLLKSSTPDPDNDFVTNLTPGTNELSVAGYARVTLTTKTVTEDTTNDFAYLDADDVAFGALAAGQTITWAILYIFITNDTDSANLAAYDVTDTPTNGGTITLVWAAPASGAILKAA